MKVNKKDYSTIWLEKNKVKIIDQTKLPFKFVIKELSSLKSFFNAIKKMEVRGAWSYCSIWFGARSVEKSQQI